MCSTPDSEHAEADGHGWRVSKLMLVSRLQSLLHAGELKISAKLAEAAALVNELQDFRVSFAESAGYVSFGARSGKHDDLVLALAIGCWYLARPGWRSEVRSLGIRAAGARRSIYVEDVHANNRIHWHH